MLRRLFGLSAPGAAPVAGRYAAVVALVATLGLVTTACGASSTEVGAGGKEGIGIAFAIGGRDDNSFNEAVLRGANQAAKESDLTVDYATARHGETHADRVQRLTTLASEGLNPVIGVGYLYDDAVTEVAKQFPDTTFGVVDAEAEGGNVYGMLFAEHEVSYLAGVAAALKTETGRVGFIGGVRNPLIQKFEAGFTQGVHDTDDTVDVEIEYLYANDDAGFTDVAKAAEKADGMLARDVDVIYTAAGQSGAGSIQEVAGVDGAWAIGVDSDQYRQPGLVEYQDAILTSAMKRVDVAVHDLVRSVEEGEPLSGTHVYDLAENGVALATSGGFVNDISPEIEKATRRIIDGDIEVRSIPARR